jgi:hypothetical protein
VVAFDLIQKRLLELSIMLSLMLRDLSDTAGLETGTTSGLAGIFTGLALVISSVLTPLPAALGCKSLPFLCIA